MEYNNIITQIIKYLSSSPVLILIQTFEMSKDLKENNPIFKFRFLLGLFKVNGLWQEKLQRVTHFTLTSSR